VTDPDPGHVPIHRTLTLTGSLAMLVLAAVLAGCAGGGSRNEGRPVSGRTIEQVLAAHTDSLMALPGVVGTAIGQCDGAPCIRVFLSQSTAAGQSRVPARLEGYLVKVEVSGPIHPRN
jgi:hypothetical protein